MSIKTKITDCNIGENYYQLKLVSDHKKVNEHAKEWEQRQIDSYTVVVEEKTYVIQKCFKQSNIQSRATELSSEDVTDEIKAILGIV